MKHYIIDGNNLIGKIPDFHRIHKKDKQLSRVKAAYAIDNYFVNKKAKVSLHFDGFAKESIKINSAKIIYSENKTSDEKIKSQIEFSNNRKSIVVVTSDNNLTQFARVCYCTVIKSEKFAKIITARIFKDEENRISGLEKDMDEFKKIFGVSEKE